MLFDQDDITTIKKDYLIKYPVYQNIFHTFHQFIFSSRYFCNVAKGVERIWGWKGGKKKYPPKKLITK